MLKQGNCVKRITDVATQGLQADTGESFLIKGLYVAPAAGNDYLTLKVERKTVGCYRIAGLTGNHLDRMRSSFLHYNLMEFLTRAGINCTIPVAEGQSFTVGSAGTTPTVVIVYDTYDGGDIRADMPNGTDSKEYMFMQYMSSSETVDAIKTVLLDTSLSPAEFPDFPCNRAVPANMQIDILGLVGSPVGSKAFGGDSTRSKYVKLTKEREVLFDEDRNGIPFWYDVDVFASGTYSSDFSLIGPCVSVNFYPDYDGLETVSTPGDPLIFTPSLSFNAGEELLVQMSFDWVTGYNILGTQIDLAAIMKVTTG